MCSVAAIWVYEPLSTRILPGVTFMAGLVRQGMISPLTQVPAVYLALLSMGMFIVASINCSVFHNVEHTGPSLNPRHWGFTAPVDKMVKQPWGGEGVDTLMAAMGLPFHHLPDPAIQVPQNKIASKGDLHTQMSAKLQIMLD